MVVTWNDFKGIQKFAFNSLTTAFTDACETLCRSRLSYKLSVRLTVC